MDNQLPIVERPNAGEATTEAALAGAQGPRECGPCTACCTAMAVSDLAKPNYCRCRYVTDHNCSIYDQRPTSCRAWSCGWLLGEEPWGDERHRPDNLGLIFTHDQVPGLKDTLAMVQEVWPGASREPKGRYLLKKLSRQSGRPLLVLSDAGGGHVTGEVIVPGPGHEQQIPRILAAFGESRDKLKHRLVEGAAGHAPQASG